MLVVHGKYLISCKLTELSYIDTKEGWYQRYENNGWRLVSDRVIHLYAFSKVLCLRALAISALIPKKSFILAFFIIFKMYLQTCKRCLKLCFVVFDLFQS